MSEFDLKNYLNQFANAEESMASILNEPDPDSLKIKKEQFLDYLHFNQETLPKAEDQEIAIDNSKNAETQYQIVFDADPFPEEEFDLNDMLEDQDEEIDDKLEQLAKSRETKRIVKQKDGEMFIDLFLNPFDRKNLRQSESRTYRAEQKFLFNRWKEVEKEILQNVDKNEKLENLLESWARYSELLHNTQLEYGKASNLPDYLNPYKIEKQKEFYMALLNGLQQDKDTYAKFRNFFGYYRKYIEAQEADVNPSGILNVDYSSETISNTSKPINNHKQMKENNLSGDDKVNNMINYIYYSMPESEILSYWINDLNDKIENKNVNKRNMNSENSENQNYLKSEIFTNFINIILGNNVTNFSEKYDPNVFYPEPDLETFGFIPEHDKFDIYFKMNHLSQLKNLFLNFIYASTGKLDKTTFSFLNNNMNQIQKFEKMGLNTMDSIKKVLKNKSNTKKNIYKNINGISKEKYNFTITNEDLTNSIRIRKYSEIIKDHNLMDKIRKFEQNFDYFSKNKSKNNNTNEKDYMKLDFSEIFEEVLNHRQKNLMTKKQKILLDEKIEENDKKKELFSKFEKFIIFEMMKKDILNEIYGEETQIKSLDQFVEGRNKKEKLKTKPLDFYEFSKDELNKLGWAIDNFVNEDGKNIKLRSWGQNSFLEGLDYITRTRVYRSDGSYYYKSNIENDEAQLIENLDRVFEFSSYTEEYKYKNHDPIELNIQMKVKNYEFSRKLNIDSFNKVSKADLYYLTLGHPVIMIKFSPNNHLLKIKKNIFSASFTIKNFENLETLPEYQRFKKIADYFTIKYPKKKNIIENYINLEKTIFDYLQEEKMSPNLAVIIEFTKIFIDHLLFQNPLKYWTDIDYQVKAESFETLLKKFNYSESKNWIKNCIGDKKIFMEYLKDFKCDYVLVVNKEDFFSYKQSLENLPKNDNQLIKEQTEYQTVEDLIKFENKNIEEQRKLRKQEIKNQRIRYENEQKVEKMIGDNSPYEIMDYFERASKINVNSLTEIKDTSMTPLIEAQLKLGVEKFHSLKILRTAEDLNSRNIKDIFELYLMRRHPVIRKIIDRVGLDPDHLELRALPSDQLAFIEELLLKTRILNSENLLDLARLYYNLIKGKHKIYLIFSAT